MKTRPRKKGTAAVQTKIENSTDHDIGPVATKTRERETDTQDHDNVDEVDETAGDSESQNPELVEPPEKRRRVQWSRVVAYGLLPGLALLFALAAGYLKWQESTIHSAEAARAESVSAAKDSTIALLSYKPDTAEKELGAARDRLTGTFLDAYTQLTHDVVIPGAKQKHIAAVATVPAAASVSATENHAVVLVFVNQATTIGADAPTDTASSVRVTLDRIGGRWLISSFDPV